MALIFCLYRVFEFIENQLKNRHGMKRVLILTLIAVSGFLQAYA